MAECKGGGRDRNIAGVIGRVSWIGMGVKWLRDWFFHSPRPPPTLHIAINDTINTPWQHVDCPINVYSEYHKNTSTKVYLV